MATLPEKFTELVINAACPGDVKPIFSDDGITYCWLKQNDIYALAVTRSNTNAAMLVTFLKRLCELLSMYYHKLEQETIRNNFVITYELLDEVMDNGIPQLTEPRILKKFITSSSLKHLFSEKHSPTNKESPASVATVVPWRAEGIKHKKNEIFLDVIEKIDALISVSNTVLRAEIRGTLRMKSFLSGMPELRLGLNEQLAVETQAAKSAALGQQRSATQQSATVQLEDIRFHHCVRLNRFEADRSISFVPPDGEFELMSYRLPKAVNDAIESELPFWVECTLNPSSMDPGASRIEYIIKIKSTFKPRHVASSVELTIPAPHDAISPSFRTSSGSVKYHPDKQCFIWTLRHFQGQRGQLLSASLSRPTVTVANSSNGIAGETQDLFYKRPMELNFELPFFTLSGINVRYLKIFEPSGYQALPWVRYITQSGSYQIRMS